MRKKRGKKGYMSIKIDLEKAYDRISWKYMEKVLQEVQCPNSMIQRLKGCISTTSTKILCYGEKLEMFNPSRGLRQGDPKEKEEWVLSH